MKFYITGSHDESLGKYLKENFFCVDTLEECDVFINCRHEGFKQVELLYEAVKLEKTIINIGSISSDGFKTNPRQYPIHKYALDKANEQLFHCGYQTTNIRLGYLDTGNTKTKKVKKISKDYICDLIFWILNQPHRIKEITIDP